MLRRLIKIFNRKKRNYKLLSILLNVQGSESYVDFNCGGKVLNYKMKSRI